MAECTEIERKILDMLMRGDKRATESGRVAMLTRRLTNIATVMDSPEKRATMERMRDLWSVHETARTKWNAAWDSLGLPFEGNDVSPIYEYCTGTIPECTLEALEAHEKR